MNGSSREHRCDIGLRAALNIGPPFGDLRSPAVADGTGMTWLRGLFLRCRPMGLAADLQPILRERGGGSRRIAACRVVSRVPRTTGERIRTCPPPELTLGLRLYLADSLTRHPRPAPTVPCATPPTAALPRRCARLLREEAPTPTRPWAGHRLRRLCSAEERRARGPRAFGALRALTRCGCLSVANAVRAASSATGLRDRAPQGTPTEGRGAASEAAVGGPPAAHARTRTKFTATGCNAPVVGIESSAILAVKRRSTGLSCCCCCCSLR